VDSDLNRPEEQPDPPVPADDGPVIDHDDEPPPDPGLGRTPMPPD
jgi:hypothetical protein